MAEKIGLEVQIEAAKAAQSVGDLKKILQDAKKQAQEIGKAFGENSDEFKAAQQQIAKIGAEFAKFGNNKADLLEAKVLLQGIIEAYGATSKEAIAAAKAAANFKDNIGDADKLIAAFDPDAKFNAFAGAIQSVAGGFSALQGAMGLFGVESKDVEKALLKVQSALKLSQGINSILEARESFSNLATIIKSTTAFQKIYAAGTAAASVVMRAFGVAVNTTSIGFKALRTAIISTGIGALIVGITYLITKIVDWVNGTDDAKDAQERLQKAVDSLNESLSRQQRELKRAQNEAIAKAKADGKSEEEIYKIRQDYAKKNEYVLNRTLNDKYNAVQEYEKYRHKDEESEKKYLEALKDYNETYDQYYENKSQQVVDKYNEQARLREDQEKKSKEAAEKQKQLNEKEKAEAKRRAEERKKELEEAIKVQREAQAELLNINASDEQKEINESIKKYNDRWDKLSKANQDPLLAYVALQEELKLIREKYHKEQEADEDANFDKLAEKTADYENKKTGITIDNNEKRRKFSELSKEEQIQSLEAVSGALTSFSELAGEETAAGKALAIAGALVNTYLAGTKALASAPPPFNYIALAGTIAAGINTVKKIVSVKVPGEGGGSAGGLGNLSSPTLPQAAAPSRAVSNVTTLDRDAINALANQALRAYVVESDITNSQGRIQRIKRSAILG